MRRFSIRGLMALVLALAVGLAALRGANDYWAGGLLLATPLLMALALLGALCGRERPRAGRLGFAVLGGTYFALAFLGLSEGYRAKLPTSTLLRRVHERVAGTRSFSVVFSTTATPTATATVAPGGPSGVTVTPQTVNLVGSLPAGPTTVFEDVTDGGAAPPNRWRAFLPGAANYAAFQAVGHCLFALLAGLLGAAIARRFERGRAAEGAQGDETREKDQEPH